MEVESVALIFIFHNGSMAHLARVCGASEIKGKRMVPQYLIDNLEFHVINLKRKPERLQCLRRHFAERGLDQFRVVYGIDFRDFTQEFVDANNIDETSTRSFYACGMSHRKIWQDIILRQRAYTVVFEDDVFLRDVFFARLDKIYWEIQNEGINFDILYLGYFDNHDMKFEGQSISPHLGIYKKGKLLGFHAYMISLKGAYKMIRNIQPGYPQCDHKTMLDNEILKLYSLTNLAGQNGNDWSLYQNDDIEEKNIIFQTDVQHDGKW